MGTAIPTLKLTSVGQGFDIDRSPVRHVRVNLLVGGAAGRDSEVDMFGEKKSARRRRQ